MWARLRDFFGGRHRRATLGLVLDATAGPALLIDEFGIIQDATVGVWNYLGYQKQDIVGHSVLDILSLGVDSDAAPPQVVTWPTVVQVRESGLSAGSLIKLRHKNGREITTYMTVIPLRPGAIAAVLQPAFLDEAHIRRVEAELSVARREAQMRGDVLSRMSHELRTPLNGVVAGLELLTMSGSFSEEQSRLIKTVQSSCDMALAGINDILDFSRIDAGMLVLNLAPFHVPSVVEAVAGIFHPIVTTKGLNMSTEVAPELMGCWVMGDVVRFRQVVINLVGNAVKFTASGCISIVATSNPVLNNETIPALAVSVAVSDTGIGIDAATQARLFAPFAQADATSTRQYGGSGLGLVIARRTAEAMGGTVAMSSTEGVGSTFTFTSLLTRAQKQTVDVEARPCVSAGRISFDGRVLVVDDSDVNRMMAERMLRKLGLQVDPAADGRTGMEMALANQYNFILMVSVL